MRLFTQNELEQLQNLVGNLSFTEAGEDNLLLLVRKYIYDKFNTQFMGFDDIKLKNIGQVPYELKEKFSIDHNTITFYCGDDTTIDILKSNVDKIFAHLDQKIRDGKYIGNIYPYALKMLFNNELPFANMTISGYFKDGNKVFIHVKITKTLSRRYRKTGNYIERDMVIEHLKNDKYITKNNAAINEMKKMIKYQNAPKTVAIKVVFDNKILEYYHDVNDKPKITIEVDEKTNMGYIKAYSIFKFFNTFDVRSTIIPWVVKTDSNAVWIRCKHSDYTSSNAVETTYSDTFFIINQLGGLVEVEENPFDDQTIDQSKIPQSINKIKMEDIRLDISEDEQKIIVPFKDTHPWLDVVLSRSTDVAREYTIRNAMHDLMKTPREIKIYFAQYENKWVHTTIQNPKIQELLYVYNLTDFLAGERASIN